MTTTFNLPYPTLTRLDPHRRPTPSVMRTLRKELYANTRKVRSSLGGGQYGHLGMVMPTEAYLAKAGVAYITPDRPEIPEFHGNGAAVAAAQELYRDQLATYKEYRDLYDCIHQQILQAVPEEFLGPLIDEDFGLADASPRQMLKHLMDNYGKIKAADLAANLERIKLPWDPDTSLETLFRQHQTCRKFATEGNDPITDKGYIQILLNIFKNSGVFADDMKDWEKKDEADHTVENITKFFTEANGRRMRHLEENTKAVLAANTATDEAASTVDDLKALLANTKEMLEKAATTEKQGGKDDGNGLNRFKYCWSHGVTFHDSKHCNQPKPGHMVDANIYKRMGGSECITIPPRNFRGKRRDRGQENTPPNNNS
jgi:hypothetical protein